MSMLARSVNTGPCLSPVETRNTTKTLRDTNSLKILQMLMIRAKHGRGLKCYVCHRFELSTSIAAVPRDMFSYGALRNDFGIIERKNT